METTSEDACLHQLGHYRHSTELETCDSLSWRAAGAGSGPMGPSPKADLGEMICKDRPKDG